MPTRSEYSEAGVVDIAEFERMTTSPSGGPAAVPAERLSAALEALKLQPRLLGLRQMGARFMHMLQAASTAESNVSPCASSSVCDAKP